LVNTEVHHFPDGGRKATVSLCTNSGKGENKIPHWHTCIFYGVSADLVSALKKGDALSVSGSLEYRSWTDQSGNNRVTAEIKVDDFSVIKGELGQIQNQGQNNGQGGYSHQNRQQNNGQGQQQSRQQNNGQGGYSHQNHQQNNGRSQQQSRQQNNGQGGYSHQNHQQNNGQGQQQSRQQNNGQGGTHIRTIDKTTVKVNTRAVSRTMAKVSTHIRTINKTTIQGQQQKPAGRSQAPHSGNPSPHSQHTGQAKVVMATNINKLIIIRAM
jgi:single-stranded DNA-binding protein